MKIALKPAFKSFLSSISPFYIANESSGRSIFDALGINAVIQDTITPQGQIYSYNYCAPLSGIIQRKARAFLNGKVWLMDKDGKESQSKEAKKLRDLMNRPNVLQSWDNLMNEAYTFKDIFGEAFIFALKGIGSNEVSSLFVIPNWIITPQYSGNVYYQTDINSIITGYKITGIDLVVPVSDVIHIKDSIINTSNTLQGKSRMVSLRDPISNIIAAYEARNVLITKRGGIGILSNNSKDVAGSIPLEQKDKDDLQKEFSTYGISKNKSQVIITSAALQWQSMTFPTRELMLFEEIEDDVRQIADNYGYPMYLLGFKAGTTYSNVGEAKKSLYQDCIIPDAESIYAELSRFFNTEKYGFTFKVFYDHLDILQKSEKDKAEVMKIKAESNTPLFEKGIITMNQLLTALDLNTVTDGDRYIYDITKAPYAIKLGVGGTQALQMIISDPNIPDNRKRNILIVVFGLTDQEANQVME